MERSSKRGKSKNKGTNARVRESEPQTIIKPTLYEILQVSTNANKEEIVYIVY